MYYGAMCSLSCYTDKIGEIHVSGGRANEHGKNIGAWCGRYKFASWVLGQNVPRKNVHGLEVPIHVIRYHDN